MSRFKNYLIPVLFTLAIALVNLPAIGFAAGSSPAKGDDSGCTAIGGICQMTTQTCRNGIFNPGLCLSNSDTNYQCCAPERANKGGLIPCNGLDCRLCDLLVLANNIISFIMQMVLVLAGAFFAFGAIMMMIAGGSKERVDSGKESMILAVKGAALALASWVIVSTVFQFISGSASKWPWAEINCK